MAIERKKMLEAAAKVLELKGMEVLEKYYDEGAGVADLVALEALDDEPHPGLHFVQVSCFEAEEGEGAPFPPAEKMDAEERLRMEVSMSKFVSGHERAEELAPALIHVDRMVLKVWPETGHCLVKYIENA